ncbi:TPA: hypothetical protein ACRNR4_006380, partial [Pseudomonas aeruginosa]
MRCLEKKGLLTMSPQLIGVLAASTQGDADAKSLQTGAWVGGECHPTQLPQSLAGGEEAAGGRWLQGQTALQNRNR